MFAGMSKSDESPLKDNTPLIIKIGVYLSGVAVTAENVHCLQNGLQVRHPWSIGALFVRLPKSYTTSREETTTRKQPKKPLEEKSPREKPKEPLEDPVSKRVDGSVDGSQNGSRIDGSMPPGSPGRRRCREPWRPGRPPMA